MDAVVCISLSIFLLFQPLHPCDAISSINSSTPLFPSETLVSPGQIFELGFFRIDGSESDHQHVGIRYTNMSSNKLFWVANREEPLKYADRSASLAIGTDGNLQLLDGQGNSLWSTNVSVATLNSSVAVLSDDGNLVLRDAWSGNSLWESFDNPGDTLLHTMKTGVDAVTGKKQYLTSWKSDTDPSAGNFVAGITSDIPPQYFVWINGSVPYWRSGVWDKSKFNGVPSMTGSYLGTFSVEQDIPQGTTYLIFKNYNKSFMGYMYIASNGSVQLLTKNDAAEEWRRLQIPAIRCDFYGTCGPFGVCDSLSSPICSCLKGFVPSSAEEWHRGNWTRGCIREAQLNCEKNTSSSISASKNQDGFLKISRVKLPDFSNYIETIVGAEDCQTWCLNNCSCSAYSYVSTIGCMIWINELVDIQKFSMTGEDLFLRLPIAYINQGDSQQKKELIISLTCIASVIVLGVAVYSLYLRRMKQKRAFVKASMFSSPVVTDISSDTPKRSAWKEELRTEDGYEQPFFSFGSILVATDNFNMANKLGQGGFGAVYKGKLQNGMDVAVKRLSSSSGQGMEEFKNEILLISKLQHRNLVRLIGCCIEEDEKILLYEYLPNKSLDTFLFDPAKKAELNWKKRFQIILGIARGLLYLHRDSQLRIIHRDLKASNILLDENLSPKISDFGLARMFQGTQDLVNTRRVVGTLGYMAPEYAMAGIFSEKSDMYSFGVLLLEIVSGKKSTSFNYDEEDQLNLLSYTWELWEEGRAVDLLDEALIRSSSPSWEVEKCIQIGLMCVQDHARNRPHMSSVVQMLTGESNLLPPGEPTFTFQRALLGKAPANQEKLQSANVITNSMVDGR